MSNVLPLVLALISQHPDVVAGLLSFVVLGAINGLLPTKVNGNIVTRVVSVLVDRLSPLTRKDARATLKWPIFSASVLRDVADAIDPPAPPRDGQSGRAQLGAVVVLLVVGLAAGAVLSGCREPADCNRQTDSWRCSPTGRPERCAEGNVWRSYAYGPCSLTGEVCVSVPGGAFCRPPRDAGASLPSNPYADASAPQE